MVLAAVACVYMNVLLEKSREPFVVQRPVTM